ncbi:MAG TPA: hypothetical protein VJ890_02605, partial [Vineibacter sp.]|nr:hypothetical protein [Vineibacter sp.]
MFHPVLVRAVGAFLAAAGASIAATSAVAQSSSAPYKLGADLSAACGALLEPVPASAIGLP